MTVDDSTAGQSTTGRHLGPEPRADGAEPLGAAPSSAVPGQPSLPDEPEQAAEPAAPSVTQSIDPMPTQPRRSPAIWAVMGALVLVLVLVVTVSASAGAFALAAVLAAAGICRAVLPGAVIGLAVRSRTVDVVCYLVLAAAMAFLAQTAPNL